MSIFNAEDSTRSSLDRVRSSTPPHVNEEIYHQSDLNIHYYKCLNVLLRNKLHVRRHAHQRDGKAVPRKIR